MAKEQDVKPRRIVLHFGALSPKLHEQAGVPEERCELLQKLADAVVLLRVHGILGDSAGLACERKIAQGVLKEIAADMEAKDGVKRKPRVAAKPSRNVH